MRAEATVDLRKQDQDRDPGRGRDLNQEEHGLTELTGTETDQS